MSRGSVVTSFKPVKSNSRFVSNNSRAEHATEVSETPRAKYNALVGRRQTLQEEKAECELAFKQCVLHPDLYSQEQTQHHKDRFPVLTADLDKIVQEIDFLLWKFPELRESLERESTRRLARLVRKKRSKEPDEPPVEEVALGESPPFKNTDLGNAERFIEQYGRNLRYCNPWKKWLPYDGQHWKADDSQIVRKWARSTIRGMYDEVKRLAEQTKNMDEGDEKDALAKRAVALLRHAVKSESEPRLNAMVSLAQMDVPVLPEHLDADLWLLNVLNGTVDLRSGELRPHRREDLLTKIIPIAYDPTASCERWEQFLSEIMAGSEELIDFLWKAIGYSLTGNTREDCLFLLHGIGANGKTTLLQILLALLGDYAKKAAFSTFLHQERESVRNDIADLRGARLVVASEVDQDKRLSEAVVKELTGRDTMKARFLFAEHFQFVPQLKLWLGANHKPVIKGRDDGIWRRINLIPFTQKFEKGINRDETLTEKLTAELPGVLAWAVRGCLAWQKEGLPRPEAVKVATESYRQEMDAIGNFLIECCELKPHLRVRATDLFNAFVTWSGDKHVTQTAFGKELTGRGYEVERSGGIWRKGLALSHNDWNG